MMLVRRLNTCLKSSSVSGFFLSSYELKFHFLAEGFLTTQLAVIQESLTPSSLARAIHPAFPECLTEICSSPTKLPKP